MASQYAWNPIVIVPIFSLALTLAVCAVILRKNRRWVVARMFLLGLAALALWDVGEVMLSLTRPEFKDTTGLFWGNGTWVPGMWMVPLALHISIAAVRNFSGRDALRWRDGLLYLPAALFTPVVLLTDWATGPAVVRELRVDVPIAATAWGAAFAAYNIGYPVAVLVWLWWGRRQTTDARGREQLKWFFFGFSIPVAQSLVFTWLPVVGISQGGFPTLSLAGALMMVVVGYGMVRYQFFDIRLRLYIRRALILSMAAGMAMVVAVGALTLVVAGFGPLAADAQAIALLAVLTPNLLLVAQWEAAGTAVVEALFPSLKWKESSMGDVFLVANSGLMVSHHRGPSSLNVPERQMVSMLTAVQDFMITSVGESDAPERKGLNVLTYGETKVLIEHGEKCYMVVVFDGFQADAIRAQVRRTLETIHRECGEALDEWDGGRWIRFVVDPPIRQMLGGVGAPSAATAAPAAGEGGGRPEEGGA